MKLKEEKIDCLLVEYNNSKKNKLKEQNKIISIDEISNDLTGLLFFISLIIYLLLRHLFISLK